MSKSKSFAALGKQSKFFFFSFKLYIYRVFSIGWLENWCNSFSQRLTCLSVLNIISKYLISEGANIEDVCADGSTLLDVAIFNDDKEIAKILSGENAKKTCGGCRKIFPFKDVRKLWRFPLFILKLVRMHPGEEGERLYCFRCSCSQNTGTVFLATMFGSLVIFFIVGLISG